MPTEPDRREDNVDLELSEAAARRAWSRPEMIIVAVTSTEGIGKNPGDGLTNLC